MQVYSREVVTEVLAANDIVDVIGSLLELKTAGSGSFKALCPFHGEKTPSFTVNRHRQTFHCFGCGKGGDVLGFIMEHEGLSFVEALRKLADRGGVHLPAASERESEGDQLRTRLIEFAKFADAHFCGVFQDPERGRPGRHYVKARQLKEDTVRRFGLGYAPEGWNYLLDAARQKGFTENVCEGSGLFKRGDRGSLYDFFRNRVIFPIRDISGNTVAFGGRDLGDSPAKYINSPETAIYKKSRVLYGLHEAREALRREKFAILVEGYFDLLRCFDAGIENVVASCGTALTVQQAALIRRYVPEVVVVYDGDAAGIHAALKGTGVLIAAGLSVRAMALPGGQDPDDYIKNEGGDAFRGLLEGAPDFLSFYVRMSRDRTASIEGRTEVAQEIFAILKDIDDELRRDEYLKQAAKELGLFDHVCRREFEKFLRNAERRPLPRREQAEAPRPVSISQDDRDFVAALLNDDALLQKARKALENVPCDASPVIEILAALLAGNPATVLRGLESEDARALYAAAATTETIAAADPGDVVARRLIRIERDSLRRKAEAVQEQIREAERARDTGQVAQLFAQKLKLMQEMEKVGAA